MWHHSLIVVNLYSILPPPRTTSAQYSILFVGDMISCHNKYITRKHYAVYILAAKSDISAKLSLVADLSSVSELTILYNEGLTLILAKHAPAY